LAGQICLDQFRVGIAIFYAGVSKREPCHGKTVVRSEAIWLWGRAPYYLGRTRHDHGVHRNYQSDEFVRDVGRERSDYGSIRLCGSGDCHRIALDMFRENGGWMEMALEW